MRTENVIYFPDTEWDFISLLADTGIGMVQAKMLVFLDRNGEATSRDIERGADMHQTEVNATGRKFLERGWISICVKKSEGKSGRTPQVYRLIKSFRLIIDDIEKEKKAEAQKELGLIKKMRKCRRGTRRRCRGSSACCVPAAGFFSCRIEHSCINPASSSVPFSNLVVTTDHLPEECEDDTECLAVRLGRLAPDIRDELLV